MEVTMLGTGTRLVILLSATFSIMGLTLLAANRIYAQVEVPGNTTTTVTTTATPSGTVTEKRTVITTSAPAPKEVITTPVGYAYCFVVKAGWYLDTWVAEHNVCQYPNSPEGVAWVEGYWVCNKYDLASGKCTSWDWKTAHWENTLSAY